MPDDKTKRGPQDAQRVNVHEEYEIQYWTRHFGCTRTQLISAVNKVGVMVKDIERELRGR
jgi:Protein of unknown function (DUF3606)